MNLTVRTTGLFVASGALLLVLGGCGRGESAPAVTNAAGERVFVQQCAVCHGPGGLGDGTMAGSTPVRPRDLTTGPYKYVDIEGHDTEVEALIDYIKVGRIENGMPPYDGMLSEQQIRDVAEWVASIRPEPNFVEALPAEESPGEEAPAEGGSEDG